LVAIPSVLAFNYLSGRADDLLLALDLSRGEFLDYLEDRGGGSGGGTHADPDGARARAGVRTLEARASASA
jgi:hypothetical protein